MPIPRYSEIPRSRPSGFDRPSPVDAEMKTRIKGDEEMDDRERMVVHFIGVGSGDPEPITVKVMSLMGDAYFVIYADSLIHPYMLRYAKREAAVHGSSSMRLEELVEMMVEYCRSGKKVVRLVSGDPSLYSAVNEQVALLEERGIRCEIVPGVSSFSAAAAALGLELTCPERSQAVILARAEGKTPLPEKGKLAEVLHPSATAAIFLSGKLGERLLEDFLAAGYRTQTPAAIVHRASWEEEKKVETTLSRFPAYLKNEGMNRQTLILVGEVLDRKTREAGRSRLYGR